MKFIFYYFFFIITTCIVAGCDKTAPKPSTSNNTQGVSAIQDSIKRLDSLAAGYWLSNDSLSIYYAKQELKLAKSIMASEQIIKAYHTLGKSYYLRHKDSSFYYYYLGLTLANQLGLFKEKPSLLFNIAMLNYDAGNWKDAMALLDSSAKSAIMNSNCEGLSNAYNSMGILYLEVHDTTLAILYFKKALHIGKEYKLPAQTGNALSNLAFFEKDLHKIITIQKEAIIFLQTKPGNEEEIARAKIDIGLEQSNPDTAMAYYNSALEESKAGKMPIVEIASYNNLAYSYLDKGNTTLAIDCLVNKAIPLADRIQNNDWLATLYDTYADVLVAKGDPANAIKALRTSIGYKKQFNSDKNEQQIRLLSAIFDLNAKEETIRENESEIKSKIIENQLLKLFITFSVLGSIIILFVFIGFRQKSKLKFKQQQIDAARRIIDIEETEKSRIGFELHDNLGFLVRMTDGVINSVNISHDNVKAELTDKMRELGDSVRRISHRVNLMKDEKLKLQELVPDIINDMNHFTGINVKYFIQGHLPDFSKEIKLHICRIVQELLTNASKYANESEIQIDIALEGKQLILLYEDDGPGFDTGMIKDKGIGLRSIYERVSLLGGDANLISTPGDGTKWEISILV